MTEDLHAQKLAWFKQNEKPEAVLFVADDPELMKIVVAWTTLDVRPAQKLTDPPDEPDRNGWDWLWANADYCVEELAEKSGLTARLVERKLRLLIGNRVIYPDGTVNSFVQRYLRERVLKLFDTKSRRSSKTPWLTGGVRNNEIWGYHSIQSRTPISSLRRCLVLSGRH